MTPERLFERIGAALMDGDELSADDLGAFEALDSDPSVYAEAQRVVGRIRDGRQVSEWGVAKLLESIATRHRADDHPARQFAAHLCCHAELQRAVREAGIRLGRPEDYADHAERLRGTIDAVEARIPAASVYEIWRGKIDSLTDRDAAVARFRIACRESPDFVDTMMAEPGPRMYFSASEVAEGPRVPLSGADERAVLREQLKGRHACFPPPTMHMQWSTDLDFFRAFGPYWFGLAPDLLRHGLGMIFLVVGEEAETACAIEEARELIRASGAFRGISDPSAAAESVIFVPAPVPKGTGQPKTYAACARHVHAEAALAETRAPLLILDVDIVLWEDFAPLLEGVRDADVGCSAAAGLTCLRPWSRHMAGMVYLEPTPGGRDAARRVREYVERGLDSEASWTLDQNALCYALEKPGSTRVARLRFKDMMSLALQPDKRIIRRMQETF